MTHRLFMRFAVLSFLCIAGLALAMGFALSSLLTRAVSDWEWENTAAFARHEVEQVGLDAFFTGPQGPETRERWGKQLSSLFVGLPEVVRVKAWDRTATVLWSDEPLLIGRRFPDNHELQVALAGKVAVEIKELRKAEHAYERGAFRTLAEIYVPLFSKERGEVLGVLEVYKTPVRLHRTIRWGQIVIWTISLAGGLTLYLVLLPLLTLVYRRGVEEEACRAYAGRLEVAVRQAEERAKKLTALSTLARLITSAQDRHQVFDEVARAATILLGAKTARVWAADPEKRVLRVQGSFGIDPAVERLMTDFSEIPYGRGIVGGIIESRSPEYVQDIREDPRWLNRRLVTEGGLYSYAGFPLVTDNCVVGVLSILFGESRRFTPEEKELMSLLADHAAIAIRNSQLLRIRQNRLEVLLELSRQFSRLQPVESLLERIAEACGRLLGTDSVGIRLVEGDELVVAATWGDAETAMSTPRLRIGESLIGIAAATGEALLVTDPADDPRLIPAHREASRRGGYRAFLGAPIKIGDRVVGALSIRTRREEGFSAEDKEVATAFASQAAVALENSRLFQESQEAYEKLKQTQDQFLQAQKMEAVGRLAGGVAHDFNNLLAVITGRAQLLERGLGSDGERRRHVELIRQAADRAAALTQQLLAFSRKQVLQPKVLDLNAVVAGMAPMLQRLIGEDVELILVPGARRTRVKADPGQLDQVVMNLAVNARDAMPRGGRLSIETANVEVDQAFASRHADARPGPHVMLSVRDTGVGMSAEVLGHIFEPFFTTKDPGKGTGLGLSTVDGLVKQHGGFVEVESAPGQGSAFKIYLPRLEEAAEAVQADPAPAVSPGGSETILLVEDEAGVRELAREILNERGYTVLEAANGLEALQVAARHRGPIDLLVADVVMPGMSGRETAERLLRTFPTLKVLYMSGYTADVIAHHGVLDPGVVLLHKPFRLEALTRAVRELLDGAPVPSLAP